MCYVAHFRRNKNDLVFLQVDAHACRFEEEKQKVSKIQIANYAGNRLFCDYFFSRRSAIPRHACINVLMLTRKQQKNSQSRFAFEIFFCCFAWRMQQLSRAGGCHKSDYIDGNHIRFI